MNLEEFKLKTLGIDQKKFGRIFSFIDFGNVNYWYEKDERNGYDKVLPSGSKLAVEIKKLADFCSLFSEKKRFYFGLDPKKKKSIKILSKARRYFDKVITKPIQRIKHYLEGKEVRATTRVINKDMRGKYVLIPKCNFDTEICVDAIRFLDKYDTFCLFSSDADFVYLLEFLKRQRKKIILVSAGYVSYQLKKKADMNINAQKIKQYITFIKQKPRL